MLCFADAILYELEYYKTTNCNAQGAVNAVQIDRAHICYDLESDGFAFHVGGPSTVEQVPQGCKINGYSDAGCNGALNIQLEGPTSQEQCYVVGSNMGKQNPVKSVVFFC